MAFLMRIILVFWPVTNSIFDSRYRQKPKAMEYNNAHNCFGPALVSKHIFKPFWSFWAWACNWSIWRATQGPDWTFDPRVPNDTNSGHFVHFHSNP